MEVLYFYLNISYYTVVFGLFTAYRIKEGVK